MSQVRTFIIFLLLLSGIYAQTNKFSGLTFFEYRNDGSNSAFDLNRAYFTYQKKLSDQLSYKFQIDAGREKIPTAVDSVTLQVNRTSPTRLYTYIKNAKLSWKTHVGTITIGMQGMNMFGVQEKNWGYRFIEKSAMDKYKFSSSADLGLGYARTFGPVSTRLLITNGAGYKKAESDSYKKVSLSFITGRKLKVAKDYNTGLVFSYEPSTTDPTVIYGVFAATQLKNLRLGGEYDMKQNGTTTLPLISFYTTAMVGRKFEFLGRIDNLNNEISVIAGFNIKPEAGLSIAPVLRYTTTDGSEATSIYTVNFQFKI